MDASSAPVVAPGPPGLPLLGNWLDVLQRDLLEVLSERHREYGDVVRSRTGPNEVLLVNDPEGVRHVLQHNHQNYVKGPSYALLEAVVGKGLLTSEGSRWLRHRKLVQPAFHRQQLERFGEVVRSHTRALAASWSERAGQELDLSAEMMRLTFQIVGEALFSEEVGEQSEAVSQALSHALSQFDTFIGLALLLPPGWLPRRLPLLGRRSWDRLDAMVMGIIERRRRSGVVRDDLLGMLMAARDEEGGLLDDEQLKDEVMTLILAGHETTANALSWTVALLGQHPDVTARLQAELETQPSGGPYTERVIAESMRLYPPAWIVVRRALGPDTVGGYPVAAGTSIQISPWTLHRHPHYWPDPLRFDPDRFTPERSQGRSSWVYLPFGGGPRVCVGKAFALTEAKLVLATLLRDFELPLVPGHPLEPHATVTLRPKYGVRVKVIPRSSA
jgi:cytochrome P450